MCKCERRVTFDVTSNRVKLTFFSPNAFMVCLHLPVFLLTGKISQNAWSPRTKHLAYQISTKRVRCLQVKPSCSKLQSVYRSAHSGKFCINKQLRTIKRLYFCLKRFSMFFIFTQYSDFLLAFQKDRTRLIENYDVVEFFCESLSFDWLMAHDFVFHWDHENKTATKNKQIKTLRERTLNFIKLKLWLTVIPRDWDIRFIDSEGGCLTKIVGSLEKIASLSVF